jgi:arylsulfatase A-like enzyme
MKPLILFSLLLVMTVFGDTKPNVLFIAIDDMNDDISLFGKEKPYKTPVLESLAKRGVFFSRAYCSSPACNPSRVSIMTGKRPHISGVYGNKSDWRKALPNALTIMQYFQRNGYSVKGAGKIFHHHMNGAFHDKASFDDFQMMAPRNMPPKKLNKAKSYGSRVTDWGAWPNDETATIDYKSADYCIKELSQKHTKPFFLACGIFKPHSPFFAPPQYHAKYDTVKMPVLKKDDWQDLPSGAKKLMSRTKWFWTGMAALENSQKGSYERFVKSYAACCTFADAQIGRVIDALDKSIHKNNTIIIVWSDHGFHLGEKEHIEKFALWEKTNHVPFIIIDPRQKNSAGKTCDRPIDLTVIYPTLLELCGLPANADVDGLSIAALVKNPDAEWGVPALMTYGFNNHAIRTEHWRYIRYADGTEELYNHRKDPHEWHNLATDKENEAILEFHRKYVPESNAKPVSDLKKGHK